MKYLGTKNNPYIANSYMWGLIILSGSGVTIFSIMVASKDLGSGDVRYLAYLSCLGISHNQRLWYRCVVR
jgi:hypothetical protein